MTKYVVRFIKADRNIYERKNTKQIAVIVVPVLLPLGPLMHKEIIYIPAAFKHSKKSESFFNVLVENLIIYKILCIAEKMEDKSI